MIQQKVIQKFNKSSKHRVIDYFWNNQKLNSFSTIGNEPKNNGSTCILVLDGHGETDACSVYKVGSNNKINCFYTVFAERKDVEKLVTEFDK